MDIYKSAENMMRMTPGVWARHANPWSGWTRVTILPLFVLAIWSRAWLGWWVLVPLVLLVVWTMVNPRAFPPIATYDNWMSRGVLGERWYLARKRVTLPAHHITTSNVLAVVSGLGMLPLIYGLWVYDISATLAGLAISVGGKLWFIDRMVWLFADMTGNAPGMELTDPKLPPEDTA